MPRLTDQIVRKALPPLHGQAMLWDDDLKGFGLRITTGGAKAFVLDYRAHGRQRRITIGSFPDWSVAAARETAKNLKREVDLGNDPMAERQEDRAALTMNDLWEKYQREHLAQKSPRSQADERSMWEQIILPRFGKEKVMLIVTEHIDTLHRDITEIRKTPVRANRVIEVLRKAFNLAMRWKIIKENPVVGVRRNPEERRNRYLNKTEIAALVTALNEHKEQDSANAIKLLMLTGARKSEVLGATWEMFDLENGIWTKPSSHTKQRKLHRVPLSAPALRLLKEIKEESASVYVFPGADGKPLQDVKRTWSAACKKAGLLEPAPKKDRKGRVMKDKNGDPVMEMVPNVRLHDLRHSFASILVSGGASLPLIGQMLGHTQVSTTQRYAHLYDDPLRKAAEMVSDAIPLPEKSTKRKKR